MGTPATYFNRELGFGTVNAYSTPGNGDVAALDDNDIKSALVVGKGLAKLSSPRSQGRGLCDLDVQFRQGRGDAAEPVVHKKHLQPDRLSLTVTK